tara:strand:- start:1593 stop:2354 length:762 start_codon:yes stop_codon:yes gene_type:complete
MIKTGLTKRIIPLILFRNFQVVKSIQYSKFRVVGNFEQTIEVFNIRDVDEIIILDIEASTKNKEINIEVLKILSKNSSMPLSFGGGIKNLTDIERCLKAGADKVIINSHALNNINFIKEATMQFGSQCIVTAIDYKIRNNDFCLYSHTKKEELEINIFDYLKRIEDSGSGEILLSSVDNDGLMGGFELTLIKKISNLKIPIILSGGCGNPEHIDEAFRNNISGIAAGSIFYFSQFSYDDIKKYSYKNEFNIRP